MVSQTQLRAEIAAAETRVQVAQSKDEGLKAAVEAAELCMRALKLTSDQRERKSWEDKCRFLLDQAERCRSVDESSGLPESCNEAAPASKPNRAALTSPGSTRELSTREQIILLEGSKLHGSIFPPWKSVPELHEFDLKDGDAQYLDNTRFSLSGIQLEVFDGWRRPDEVLPRYKAKSDSQGPTGKPTMIAHDTVDLVQDVTTDCSVVASLCAGTARAERGYPKIASSIMFPYDHQLMNPAMSRSGKYVFKLHFNGCFRKVVIDDRLPSSRTSRSLHVVDRSDPMLLWPALIEKAYLKVRGGYDLPGSNSGTDIWVLTSWVPEQLFLQSDDIVRKVLWSRLYSAFNYGDVLITMGTGKLTEIEEDSMGLAGEHDYAVIAMKESAERRLLLIKNPWAEGTAWKGSISYGQPPDSLSSLEAKSSSFSGLTEAHVLRPGTFWMDMNDVFQSFESIYLNWNPGLFSYREDIHFIWDLAKKGGQAGSFRANPQYEIRSRDAGVVWLLLSRHFKSHQHTTGSNEADHRAYISLYAYANNGARVFRSDGAFIRGHYVDSPNTLLKLEMPVDAAYTIVVSEQSLPKSSLNFTLSAFSVKPIVLREAQERYKHHVLQQGAWTSSTAGGNASSAIYYTNPQYSIQLPEQSDLSLLLESADDSLPVHVKLVWSQGKPITSIKTRDIAGDSGEYQNGYAIAEICDVDAGKYTVVCSAFDTGQLGAFNLHIYSMACCAVDPLPVINAGRLASKLETAFFTSGHDRLVAPLFPGRITRLSMFAIWGKKYVQERSTSRSPLKLALEYGQGPAKQSLTVSNDDEFVDHHVGIRTADVDVVPAMSQTRGLWIVLERFGRSESPQEEESIQVEVLSDAAIDIGPWVVRDG